MKPQDDGTVPTSRISRDPGIVWMPKKDIPATPMPTFDARTERPVKDPDGPDLITMPQTHAGPGGRNVTTWDRQWVYRSPDGRSYAVDANGKILWSRWDGV